MAWPEPGGRRARFLLSVGLSTRSTKNFVNSATLRGRLPNERKIPVFPWTTRENGIILGIDLGSLRRDIR
jgi:hypothetical protein